MSTEDAEKMLKTYDLEFDKLKKRIQNKLGNVKENATRRTNSKKEKVA
jgi:hypothetical protein